MLYHCKILQCLDQVAKILDRRHSVIEAATENCFLKLAVHLIAHRVILLNIIPSRSSGYKIPKMAMLFGYIKLRAP